MNNIPQRKVLARTCIFLFSCQFSSALAEQPAPVEVRPNDTLSAIVVEAFPGYNNRRVIMQAILEKNPQAFVNNDINRLIVGRTLQLPDIATLPVTQAQSQPAQNTQSTPDTVQADSQNDSARAEVLAQLESLTEERDKLSAELGKLEAENRLLRSRVEELEQLKTQQDEQLRQLDDKIKALQVALADSQGTDSAGSQAEQNNRAELEKLRNTNNATQAELTTLRDEHKVVQTELAQLQDTSEIAQAELKQLQSEHEAAQTELQKRQDENIALQTGNEAAQAELKELRDANTTLAADNEQLTRQLTEAQASGEALGKENNTLQQQVSTLKADAPEIQQQLEQLLANSETLKAENAALNEQLTTVRDQLSSSQQNVESLRGELAVLDSTNATLQQDLAALNLKNSDLQSELDTANQQSATLKTEIAQINAAAANDVNLVEKPQPAIDFQALWPWLLALLLLPIAWLLGRRSNPAPEQALSEPVLVTDGSDKTGTIGSADATNDPVIPVSEPGELDNISQSSAPVLPENPDAGIKLDMAHAYLDLRDSEAANDMLREVIREGGTQQQQEAREIMSFLK